MSAYYLEFSIPGLPKTTNAGGRAHWAVKVKEAERWKWAVGVAVLRKQPSAPLRKAQVTLTRHSSVEPEYDGLVSSFKAILDALTLHGVIADDQPSVIGVPKYEWKKAPPNQGRVEVCVRGEVE
jgi:Holliday junction resolvase RusA-like endonuclease